MAGTARLALIHNGIIENFHSLKKGLLADGVEFTSETDTEVVAHLVAAAYEREHDLTDAMRAVVADLEGAFTLLAIHADQPGVVVGARRNSPLVVGLGDDANYLGSDVAAFIGHTRHALEARPGPDRHDHARRRQRHQLRRHARRGQGVRGHLGRRGCREGRLRDVHGEGDPRPAARRG